MMQGYFLHQKNPRVVFDLFFRRAPFGGGFSVFAGLETALRFVKDIRFTEEDIAYLQGLGAFRPEFLRYLEDLRFRGDIWAMEEGTLAFPGEPLLRVHATLIEAQLLESALLAIVNFQTLIATKAARVRLAANGRSVIEFGLRRAQGIDGALSASRAAYIGGASATSNTLAGKRFSIPVRGTMAHSWVMVFENEQEAFERYADAYPDNALLLIDTYDTLGSGIQNAVAVGRRLKAAGHRGFGVRLDSGDLEYLSKQVRARLDAEGLQDALIVASNDLDEAIIHQLTTQGAPIDVWGVGTNLVTGAGDPALTGVYKLAARERDGAFEPAIKVSNNPEKVTNPGTKQVWRFVTTDGSPVADLICLEEETLETGRPYTFHHPHGDYRSFTLKEYGGMTPLLKRCMSSGEIVGELPALPDLQARTLRNLQALDETYKRLINPHAYKVSLSSQLSRLKAGLIRRHLTQGEGS